MNTFKFDSLNRKALSKITILNKLVLNHSSELKAGFDLPLAREKNGTELTSKDFEALWATYVEWRVSNGLSALTYQTRLFEVGNVSTEEKKISMETFFIRLAEVEPNFTCVETPNEYLKRDGKKEKETTAKNNEQKKETEQKLAEAEKIVSEKDEVENADKVTERNAEKLNAEIDADNAEIEYLEKLKASIKTTVNRIELIVGDLSKEQKDAIADALKSFANEF